MQTNRYYYGTSAYKIDNYYEKKALNAQRIERIKARRKAKRRMQVVGLLAAAFAVACIILYRNVVIIEASSEVAALSSRLEEVKSANTKKSLALEQSLDLKKVEDIAVNELGMKRPDKYQTVYVDVTQNDYAEVAAKEEPAKPFQGVFSVIRQGVINILEYLQ